MDNARPEEVLAFLRDNAGVMKSSRNHGFYGMSFRYGGDRMAAREYRRSHYLNDWQFAMWTLLNTCGRCNVRNSEIYAELSEYERDNYPFGTLLEYCAIPYGYGCDREKFREELKAFAGKYDGKAVSAWAKADLLDMEFSDLNDNDADGSPIVNFTENAVSCLRKSRLIPGMRLSLYRNSVLLPILRTGSLPGTLTSM